MSLVKGSGASRKALPGDGFTRLEIPSGKGFPLPVCWERRGFLNTHAQQGIFQPPMLNITLDGQFLPRALGCFAPAVPPG